MEAKLSSENARVARAAGVVGISTMLSRIFGFIRDMVVARYFGAGLVTDAFFVAFRIPNLLRRLLAEGSLTVSFVPVFTEYLKVKSKEEALELANVAFTHAFDHPGRGFPPGCASLPVHRGPDGPGVHERRPTSSP